MENQKKDILVVGSLNIDIFLQLKDLPQPGETTLALHRDIKFGGKGLNQAVAIKRSGGRVCLYGSVGSRDGEPIVKFAQDNGIDCSEIRFLETDLTGQAYIYRSESGENSIVVSPAANTAGSICDLEKLFDKRPFSAVLTQNETNLARSAMEIGRQRGLLTIFNPSPATEELRQFPFGLIDILIMNEVEIIQLSGEETAEQGLRYFGTLLPLTTIIATLGKEGALLSKQGTITWVQAPNVNPVDTTGAGDTFVGYLSNLIDSGVEINRAIEISCKAASISTLTFGAANSIPTLSVVTSFSPQ